MLPSTLGQVPECRDEMIALLSIFPVFFATASISWPTAYASAEVESMSNGVPPYCLSYADTNCVLPFDLEVGNQSPQLKMPSVFFAPTLLGNSVGELAPFERNRNLGLNPAWTIAFTCE